MRSCFVCDTPYQLLNCINWKYYNEFEAESDIYIGNQFYDCIGISERLKKTEIFNNVYVFSFPSYNNVKTYIKDKYKELFHIKESLEEWVNCNENINMRYDTIYLSIYSHVSFGLVQINPTAKIIFYDDGIGTYLGRALKVDFKKRKILYQLLGLKFPNLKFDELIVNNKKFYLRLNSKIDYPVKEFNKEGLESGGFSKLVNYVFEYRNVDLYKKKKIIFLTQPDDDHRKKHDIIEKEILNSMKEYSDSIIVRVHPRQYEYNFDQYDLDKERTIWELIALNRIDGNKIIVSVFSTAQFIPKIMYGREPILIFTYKLHNIGYTEQELMQMENSIKMLREIYEDEEKIHIAESIVDLNKILKKNMN